MAQPPAGVAPFDFAAAARLKEERARQLLAEEEARNSSEHGGGGGVHPGGAWGSKMMQQLPPNVAKGSSPLERQQLVYNAVVAALVSAGVKLLRPPVVEAAEGSLSYTVRGREGLDLYELKLSSQRHFVLVRTAKSTSAFGPTGLVAAHGLAAAADVSTPMVGNTLTLLLDLSRYVVEREGGALVLVNEALLLSNLNENTLGRYGLQASSVHGPPPPPKRGAKGGPGKFVERIATALMMAAAAAAAAVVVAAAVAGMAVTRARRR